MSDEKDKTTMAGSVKNLLLTDKSPEDRKPLRLINELTGLIEGVRPKDAYRNFLLRVLPNEINRMRKNGGQLV